VCPKSESAALANTTTASDCQTPRDDEPGEGLDGYGGKEFEKMGVLIREWRMPREMSTVDRYYQTYETVSFSVSFWFVSILLIIRE